MHIDIGMINVSGGISYASCIGFMSGKTKTGLSYSLIVNTYLIGFYQLATTEVADFVTDVIADFVTNLVTKFVIIFPVGGDI